MILDKPIRTTSAELERDARAEAEAAERAELTAEQERSLAHADHLLTQRRIQKVLAMTVLRFAELDQVERRNYARWARHFATVFEEKANLFSRNSTPDPEIPAALRAEG
jgi:hypothetical protein